MNMKKALNSCLIICLLFSLNSCFLFRKSKSKFIKSNYRPKRILTPAEIESRALSNFHTALVYESQYYSTKDTKYALVAINYFTKYYKFAPNGPYACYALLKNAELFYHIGKMDKAFAELRIAKSRKDFLVKYRNQINKIEGLFNLR